MFFVIHICKLGAFKERREDKKPKKDWGLVLKQNGI